LRPVALPVRAPGGLQGALPGRLHLRRGGPDARVVLFAPRDRRHRVRRARLQERDRERAGARRAGPEDVEEPRQRGEPLGGHRGIRCGRGAALPAGPEPGMADQAVRSPAGAGDHGGIPQCAAEHLRVLPTLCPRLDAARGGRSEEHTSELQSLAYLVCRLLLEKKKIETIAFDMCVVYIRLFWELVRALLV